MKLNTQIAFMKLEPALFWDMSLPSDWPDFPARCLLSQKLIVFLTKKISLSYYVKFLETFDKVFACINWSFLVPLFWTPSCSQKGPTKKGSVCLYFCATFSGNWIMSFSKFWHGLRNLYEVCDTAKSFEENISHRW